MLVHQGGKITAAAPMSEQSFSTSLSGADPFRKRHDAPFEASSPIDGRAMIYLQRACPRSPAPECHCRHLRAMRQAWQEDLLIGGSGLFLMVLIMFVLARVALNVFRRLEDRKQALQESEFRGKFALEGAGDGRAIFGGKASRRLLLINK